MPQLWPPTHLAGWAFYQKTVDRDQKNYSSTLPTPLQYPDFTTGLRLCSLGQAVSWSLNVSGGEVSPRIASRTKGDIRYPPEGYALFALPQRYRGSVETSGQRMPPREVRVRDQAKMVPIDKNATIMATHSSCWMGFLPEDCRSGPIDFSLAVANSSGVHWNKFNASKYFCGVIVGLVRPLSQLRTLVSLTPNLYVLIQCE